MKSKNNLKKNIKLLEDKKEELISDLNKPIAKGLGYEEVLLMSEKLQRVNNAISYLTRNYLD